MPTKLSLNQLSILFVLVSLLGCSRYNKQSPVVLTKEQILTKTEWQVEEVAGNINGSNYHYIRGRKNNTGPNYDIYRLRFNTDGTGTYMDSQGIVYSTSWKFTSADHHNMTLTLDTPTPVTYSWNMVEISTTSFQSITILNSPGNNILQSTRYVPVPGQQ